MKQIILSAILLASLSAHATGDFVCTALDANVNLEISATTAIAPGNPLVYPTKITLDVKADQPGAIKFGKLEMSEENVVQYWNNKNNLNLHITKENEEGDFYAVANLILETKSNKGTYELHLAINSPNGQATEQILKGKISCETE